MNPPMLKKRITWLALGLIAALGVTVAAAPPQNLIPVYLWLSGQAVSASNPVPMSLATTIAGEDQDGDTQPTGGQAVMRVAPGNVTTLALLNAVTSATTGTATRVYGGMKAIRAEGTDSGAAAVAITVEIYGSNESNTTAGLLLCTLTVAGTDVAADGCVVQAPWPFLWGKTTAVGSNDSVTVTVSQ